MESSSRKPDRGMLLISNLPSLQNLIKRDPEGYATEFSTQWDHYQSLRSVIHLGLGLSGGGDLLGTSTNGNTNSVGASNKGRRETELNFREIVGFLSQTAPCYASKSDPPRPVKSLPNELSSLLIEKHDLLHPDTRKSMIQALVGLRRKDLSSCMISNLELLRVLFALLPITTSPQLRASILKTILSDIKLANKKSKNHKLNRSIQGLLLNMVERGVDPSSVSGGSGLVGTGTRRGKREREYSSSKTSGKEAMWAVKLAAELWRKGIWNDGATIRTLTTACFHSNTKVQSASIHFFLSDSESGNIDSLDSDEEPNEEINVRQVKHVQSINKKRKSTSRKAEKKIKQANKQQRFKQAGDNPSSSSSFSALQSIQDPQQVGERLYESLLKNDKFFTLEHKVLILRLFSRISATHKLQILPFYSYILKYITHHQLEVTAILAALAESVHELTPPDVLEPCLRKLANEFVHPGVASTVIAAGINSITEISRRQPLAMESDLLADLIEYKKSKDKGVITASRALLGLFREVNPSLLKNRERGKKATMDQLNAQRGGDRLDPVHGLGAAKIVRYGQLRDQVSSIAGIELLEQELSSKNQALQTESNEDNEDRENDDDEVEGWEVESVDSDDSDYEESDGGWVDVSSDEDDDGGFDFSDSSGEEDAEGGKRETRKARMHKKRKIDTGGWKAGESTRNNRDQGNGETTLRGDKDINLIKEDAPNPSKPLSESLASKKILTPADFAKLNQLRIQAVEQAAKETNSKNPNSVHQKLLKQLRKQAHTDPSSVNLNDHENGTGFVSEGDIIGVQKKAKRDYEERMASIQSGREGREKFGCSKARGRKGHKYGATGSTTNETKSRQKAFAMTQHSNRVRSKKGASLRERQKVLRNHIERKKRGGRRGNR
ncbi:SDA1-domain-containing protein [Phakopsora pachyrhizi]|uniref:Protein SDA1 n=1 Tax=Phakopsora pachyrhizi TaxID=170000 RepID=A0AAV0AUT5_PHAPC|nr:SDA1-domain-containing protein [Phakopsora pachyrhizi]CAH7672593.1 SDA1-domain-containing protein [Phakopsora pachyrhizi]